MDTTEPLLRLSEYLDVVLELTSDLFLVGEFDGYLFVRHGQKLPIHKQTVSLHYREHRAQSQSQG